MIFPEEAEIVSKLVLEAADEILSIYHTDFQVREKSKGDPITEADLRANEIIAGGIRRILDQPVFSEEETSFDPSRSENSKVWILDPIDGTREFVAKNPEFAISLGLVENGNPVFGIVMNPASGEFIWGQEGIGAGFQILTPPYRDQKIDWKSTRLYLQELSDRDVHEIVVSVSETRDGLYNSLDWENRYKLEAVGSIAYKLGLVAVGKYPLALSLRPKNDWDVAGGIAVLRASGGLDLEIRSGDKYPFLRSRLGIGLLAGKKEEVLAFWEKYKKQLQSSVRDRW